MGEREYGQLPLAVRGIETDEATLNKGLRLVQALNVVHEIRDLP